MAFLENDSSNLLLISRILTMYYIEDRSQAEIGKLLDLSTAKVNRLLKQAREQGLVEVNIRTPFNHLFEIERELHMAYSIPEAYIIPYLTDNPETALQTLGKAAAEYLLQRLRDGDTICVSGGKTVHAIVEAIEPRRSYEVKVVPATGARQGKLFTDVNYLAARLAEKLGGESYQLNAPIFVDTAEECETLLSMRHISEILNIARNAQIALVGIGSIIPGVSSYFDLLGSLTVDIEALDEGHHRYGWLRGNPCVCHRPSRTVMFAQLQSASHRTKSRRIEKYPPNDWGRDDARKSQAYSLARSKVSI